MTQSYKYYLLKLLLHIHRCNYLRYRPPSFQKQLNTNLFTSIIFSQNLKKYLNTKKLEHQHELIPAPVTHCLHTVKHTTLLIRKKRRQMNWRVHLPDKFCFEGSRRRHSGGRKLCYNWLKQSGIGGVTTSYIRHGESYQNDAKIQNAYL